MPTAARRRASRSRTRAVPRPASSTAVLEEPESEPEDLPEVGDLLPTVTDIEQVMMGVNDPDEGTLENADSIMESIGSLGPVSAWTTPEAQQKGKNFVKHTHERGGQYTTVYDRLGNDYRMLKEDVPAALMPVGDDEARRQRFLRCPRCRRMPNHGIHSQAGPNGCPARPKRLMTYCDVCAAHGERVIVYEDHDSSNALAAPPIDISDPLYRPPATPSQKSREQALQMKLDDHIRAFHINTARQRGLRRD